MPEQIQPADPLVWGYEILLPPSPGDGKQILLSVKRYHDWEQMALVYAKSADGGWNKIAELGANGAPGSARLDHPEEPTALVVRMRYREATDQESPSWRESALKLVYGGPEEVMSHGNPQFRQNRIVLGGEIRPREKIAGGAPLNGADLRMNLSYNGLAAEVRPIPPASIPVDAG